MNTAGRRRSGEALAALLFATPVAAQSSGTRTYCNPLDLDYKYNFEQHNEGISYRSGADPVIVVQRGAGLVADASMESGRDGWYHDLMKKAAVECPPEPMDSEDMLYILYTSGTTGTPKGVSVPIKALAGFRAYAEFGLGLKPDDLYWCAADPGWAYGLYFGILLCVATWVVRKGKDSATDYFLAGRNLGRLNSLARWLGNVEPEHRHRQPWGRLVTTAQADEAVEWLAAPDELHRVGDHLAADERRPHPRRGLREVVRNGDRVELERGSARSAHACSHVGCELALAEIARHRPGPRRRDPDQGTAPITFVEAHRAQMSPRSSTAGTLVQIRVREPTLHCSDPSRVSRSACGSWRGSRPAT
jgi:hypothetical protein